MDDLWGLRRWICPFCRTVLATEESYPAPWESDQRCAAERHFATIDLDGPDGHDELWRRTWSAAGPSPWEALRRFKIGRAWRRLRRRVRAWVRQAHGGW